MGAMGQLGFFVLSRRDEGRGAKNDPLAAIAAVVPCESFRPKLKAEASGNLGFDGLTQ